eukprot:c13895_g1_i1 orf=2-241(-)
MQKYHSDLAIQMAVHIHGRQQLEIGILSKCFLPKFAGGIFYALPLLTDECTVVFFQTSTALSQRENISNCSFCLSESVVC